MQYYDWPGKFKPRAHQYVMAEFMANHPRCHNNSEMRTGKTAASIWAADWLMKQGLVKSVLIIAPLSSLRPTWSEEIFRLVPDRSSSVLHGGSSKDRLLSLSMPHDFYIINPDGLVTIANEVHKRDDINLIILDEADLGFRTATNMRYKALCRMLKPTTRLWLMTGTPCPRLPTDVWSLARLVDPKSVPQYFTSFKRQMMEQVTQYKWVPKEGAIEAAFQCLQPGIRFTQAECLDLPEVVHMDRECEFTPEQKKVYKKLHDDAVWESEHGSVQAVNAAVMLTKLMQVATGTVKNSEKENVELPCGPRHQAVLDAVNETDHKVIVFCPFKAQQARLVAYLQKHGIHALLVNGAITGNTRNDIFNQFKGNNKYKVLVAHPDVTSHSLDLSVADTIIWDGPTFKAGTYMQANARIMKHEKKRTCAIIHLYGSKVEREAYRMLNMKLKTQAMVLELFKREVVGV